MTYNKKFLKITWEKAYYPQLLNDFAYFLGTHISANNFQWLLPKIRYEKWNTEGNVKESKSILCICNERGNERL